MGSAFASHGTGRRGPPSPVRGPRITTELDQMSVLKCRASASRAWLSNLSATRFSRRERQASTTIEMPMTTKAQTLGSISTE